MQNKAENSYLISLEMVFYTVLGSLQLFSSLEENKSQLLIISYQIRLKNNLYGNEEFTEPTEYIISWLSLGVISTTFMVIFL